MQFSRNVPIHKKVDVCIIGGGPAGCSAGLAAVKNGANVFLAESQYALGGLGTVGMVPIFMTFTDGVNFVADGIGREIHEKLRLLDSRGPLANAINAEFLKETYDDLMIENKVDFLLGCEFIGAETNGKKAKYAIFNSKGGLFAVEAEVFIDCSGDGDLAASCGAKFDIGNENGITMPGTLCSTWANIDWQRLEKAGIVPREEIWRGFETGMFKVNNHHHTGIVQTGWGIGGGNMGHSFGLNPLDPKSLTEAMIEGRKQNREFENFYRKFIPGFENAELSGTGAIHGVRDSRRIKCNYELNMDDYLARQSFEDEIGRYCYPIDIHPATPDQKGREECLKYYEGKKYQPGESYGIPYRSLQVAGFDNLLCAGRCIGTDRFVQGSIRTMPGCYITGQAAGCAAALASKNHQKTNKIEIRSLQKMLQNLGAFLPNAL